MRLVTGHSQRPHLWTQLYSALALMAAVALAGFTDPRTTGWIALLACAALTCLLNVHTRYWISPRIQSTRNSLAAGITIRNAIAITLYLWAAGFRFRSGGQASWRFGLYLLAAGAAAWVIAFLILVLSEIVGWAAELLLNRIRRFPRPHECQACGYDLRGSPSERCPECGEVAPAELHGVRRRALNAGARGSRERNP